MIEIFDVMKFDGSHMLLLKVMKLRFETTYILIDGNIIDQCYWIKYVCTPTSTW